MFVSLFVERAFFKKNVCALHIPWLARGCCLCTSDLVVLWHFATCGVDTSFPSHEAARVPMTCTDSVRFRKHDYLFRKRVIFRVYTARAARFSQRETYGNFFKKPPTRSGNSSSSETPPEKNVNHFVSSDFGLDFKVAFQVLFLIASLGIISIPCAWKLKD